MVAFACRRGHPGIPNGRRPTCDQLRATSPWRITHGRRDRRGSLRNRSRRLGARRLGCADGSRLALTSSIGPFGVRGDGNALKVWDVEDGGLVFGIDRVGTITDAVFAADGSFVLVGTSLGRLMPWEVP